jgi:3-isopropylmalate/(R)-2-methylmalate dehydratase large subunit
VSKLEPTVAAPHSPDNRKLARECRDVKIDRVYIGSCTGGKTEDFMTAAKLLHGAGQEVKVPTYLVPATQKVGGPCGEEWGSLDVGPKWAQLQFVACIAKTRCQHAPSAHIRGCLQVWADVYTLPVPGCDGKTAAQIFEAAGCVTPAAPSCAACLGGPRDTFARMNEPEVCVSTTNRCVRVRERVWGGRTGGGTRHRGQASRWRQQQQHLGQQLPHCGAVLFCTRIAVSMPCLPTPGPYPPPAV